MTKPKLLIILCVFLPAFLMGGIALALDAPTLTVAVAGKTVSLSWTSVAGASGYTLYYAPYPEADPIRNIPMGDKTSMSASLSEGTAFYVALKAYDGVGTSGYSNIEHFIIDMSPTFYVDVNGSDTNDGSQANPWKSIGHAVDRAVAGDTVLINPGTYVVSSQISITNSGTAASPITFKGNGAGVVVDMRTCNAKNCLEIFFADYIVIDNLTVYASQDPNSRGIRLTHAEGCTISNNTVSGANHANLFCAFSDNVTFLNNEAFNGAIGIYVADSTDYPTVKGNRLHDNTAIGLHMNGDINSGGDGTISYALVDSNMSYDNGATGINLDGVTWSTFQNNLVYGNTYRGIAFFQQDGAVPSNDNNVIQNTIITPSGAYYGIGLNYGANRNNFYNNIILTEGSVPGFSTTGSAEQLEITSNYNLLPDQGEVVETSLGGFSFSPMAGPGVRYPIGYGGLEPDFSESGRRELSVKGNKPCHRCGNVFPYLHTGHRGKPETRRPGAGYGRL